MKLIRLLKIFTAPVKMLFAQLYPLEYAKYIGVKIKGKVKIYGSSYYTFSSEPYLVTLGDNVFISLQVRFICHDGSTLPFRRKYPDLDIAKKITVGNNVFIGLGACILPGVTIGDDCIIGAFSVVTKAVPNGSIVGGNPARIIKSTNDYLKKALENSLKIGHLYGKEKVIAYKRIFNLYK
jgi:acetyltransferase-like isoleucine patch superfamily enzyme